MKTILFSILLLFSINGFAFNWKKVAEGAKNGDSNYIDVDNIRKHNGLVYYWQLVDKLEPLDGGVNAYIDKWKVDCGEEKRTWLNTTDYSQPMGKGRITDEFTSNKILYPKPNSVEYEHMKFACNNAR